MHLSDRAVFGKPPRPRCVVDPHPLGRPLGTGDHFEEAAAQRVTHRFQRALCRHRSYGSRLGRCVAAVTRATWERRAPLCPPPSELRAAVQVFSLRAFRGLRPVVGK
jgi:hypothetical protein